MNSKPGYPDHLDMAKFGAGGRDFLDRILAHEPEWIQLAKLTKVNDVLSVSIRFKAPNPVGNVALELLYNDVEGPTMIFGPWHDHIQYFSAEGDDASYESMWSDIKDIFADKKVVLVDGQRAIFMRAEAVDYSKLPAGSKLISWSGSLDFHKIS